MKTVNISLSIIGALIIITSMYTTTTQYGWKLLIVDCSVFLMGVIVFIIPLIVKEKEGVENWKG